MSGALISKDADYLKALAAIMTKWPTFDAGTGGISDPTDPVAIAYTATVERLRKGGKKDTGLAALSNDATVVPAAAPASGSASASASSGGTGSPTPPATTLQKNVASLAALLSEALVKSVPLGGPVPKIKAGKEGAVVAAFIHACINGPFGVTRKTEWSANSVTYQERLSDSFDGKLTNNAWKNMCTHLVSDKKVHDMLKAAKGQMSETYGDVWPVCDKLHTLVVTRRKEAQKAGTSFDQAAFLKSIVTL